MSIDKKRLSIVSRATPARSGVVSCCRLQSLLGHLQGPWTDIVDAPAHVNAKGLMALLIFLWDFLPSSDVARNLLWRTDSTAALAYVRNEGGSISLPFLLTREVLLLAHPLRLRILPVFIPTEENLHADAASRFQSLPARHLPPAIFDAICLVGAVRTSTSSLRRH